MLRIAPQHQGLPVQQQLPALDGKFADADQVGPLVQDPPVFFQG